MKGNYINNIILDIKDLTTCLYYNLIDCDEVIKNINNINNFKKCEKKDYNKDLEDFLCGLSGYYGNCWKKLKELTIELTDKMLNSEYGAEKIKESIKEIILSNIVCGIRSGECHLFNANEIDKVKSICLWISKKGYKGTLDENVIFISSYTNLYKERLHKILKNL